MPTQTADNADRLSDNPDDLLRHAPPVYNYVFDSRSKIGRVATRFFDVACQRTLACEPNRARVIPPRPEEAVAGAITTLHATMLPAPATPKPDAPPQGEGGTERPLAGCPFPQGRKEVSESRGPSLYVGDSSLQAWFLSDKSTRLIMEQWWTEGDHTQG